jgi:hypothetical protein
MSVVVKDNVVVINGVAYNEIDMSSLDPTITAVQWIEETGWIEFANVNGIKPENKPIESFEPFQDLIAQWEKKDRNYQDTAAQLAMPTAQQNKETAEYLLQKTDWATLPDVNILNRTEYIQYRTIVRQYVINPVVGQINWPKIPKAIWE